MTAAATACIVGQERGFRCLPPVPGRPFCAKHDPERKADNVAAARRAALASHARRVDPELVAWSAGLDLSTDDSRRRVLTEAAMHVATGKLSAAQAGAIAALVRAAAGKPGATPPTTRPPIVVESALANGRAGESRSTGAGGGGLERAARTEGAPPILSGETA